jgi:Glycosyl hydrolase family 26
MTRILYTFFTVLALLAGLSNAFTPRVAKIVPTYGTYFGVALEFSEWNNSIKGVPAKIGMEPASYVMFIKLPMEYSDIQSMDKLLPQIAKAGLAVILTPEPVQGLSAVTDQVINRMVDYIYKYENKGVTFIVRFAHEMNGSWYAWGQRPSEYVQVFRRVSTILRARTKRATILWGPNVGTGYPYNEGQYEYNCTARPLDCKLLDTNRDGKVDQADDMFSPYWPGDAFVDWVGTSLYWWGSRWPFGENEIPTPNNFANILNGKQKQDDSDLYVPDFYGTYSKNKNMAMMITETSSFYNLCDQKPSASQCQVNIENPDPPSDLNVKSPWWEQVYSLEGAESLRIAFPNIKLVSWFNIKKVEAEAGGNTVDWTVSVEPDVKKAFNAHMAIPVAGTNKKYWMYGADFRKRVWGATTKTISSKIAANAPAWR